MIFVVLVLALGGIAAGMILLEDSWLQLLLAGALGVIFTQFAFLGHEASHRQIFESGQANDRSGRALAGAFVGISYSWWMNKHALGSPPATPSTARSRAGYAPAE